MYNEERVDIMVTFFRNINVKVENLDSNLMRAVAVMKNNATNALKINNFEIEVLVERSNLKIKSIENIIIDGSAPICSEVASKVQSVVGQSIVPGYNKKVTELIGGEKGCTHMLELLIEVGRCIHQGNIYYEFENIGLEKCIEEYKKRSKIGCIKLSRQSQ